VPAKRRHRGQLGAFLDALGFPVGVRIRSRKLRVMEPIYQMYEHGSQEARARWRNGRRATWATSC
jgi:hypothetical protein